MHLLENLSDDLSCVAKAGQTAQPLSTHLLHLIQPLTVPTTFVSSSGSRGAGTAVCVYEPGGQAMGPCGCFCRTAHTATIPSAQRDKATPSREFFPDGREIHPKAGAPSRFPPLFASGNCRASASPGLCRLWVPSADQRRRMGPGE